MGTKIVRVVVGILFLIIASLNTTGVLIPVKAEPESGCDQVQVTTSGFHTKQWPVDAVGPYCIQLTFEQGGEYAFTNIYAFWAPIYLGGVELPLIEKPEELADHAAPFNKEVSAGEVMTFTVTRKETQAEVGVWWTYMGPVVTPTPSPTPAPTTNPQAYLPAVYLPRIPDLVFKPGDTGRYQVNGENENLCWLIQFQGAQEAKIEKGWFFGKNITVNHNGDPVEVSVYTVPELQAPQFRGFVLKNPGTLELCVEDDPSPKILAEIGIFLDKVVP